MFFTDKTFVMAVSITGDKADSVDVTVELEGCEVGDEIVADSATSGQSPRVSKQAMLRRDGLPKGNTLKMTWAEWFGKPTRARGPARRQTDAEILAGLLSDPVRLKLYMDQLGVIAARSTPTPLGLELEDEDEK